MAHQGTYTNTHTHVEVHIGGLTGWLANGALDLRCTSTQHTHTHTYTHTHTHRFNPTYLEGSLSCTV